MSYTADNIQFFEGIEHVRLRPSMYIGDVGYNGFHHLVNEVIDNSIDETIAGFCNKILITIHKDNSITIIDNGRGIPVDIHKKEGCSALELVMTKIGAGGKFDKNSYKISGGLHGVGISCVNALSEWLVATIYRDNKIYRQKYSKGIAITDLEYLGTTSKRGTEITFKADNIIFKNIKYDYDILAKRIRELSFLNKGLSIYLTDEREIDKKGNFKNELFFSKLGLKEFLDFIDKDSIIKNIILIEDKINDIIVEIAMKYNHSFKEKILSYVNNINTKEGGTHLTGFRRAITRTLKKYAEENGFLKKENIDLIGDDFREGITAIISIKLMSPQFEGQTKTKLGNNEVIGAVDKIVGDMFISYLDENPYDAKKIIEKIIIAAKARKAAKKARELIHNNNTSISTGLPGKLADCSLIEPKNCEIFLVEGDSAGGTAKQGRDRNFQAILPLRGKILNVEKAMENKIYENEEIRNIFMALGIYLDEKKNINIDKLRYYKIIIMTDADIDGSHISTLIITFFFRYMKILIEKGFIYIAMPPLYLIKKGKKSFYAWNEKDRERIIKDQFYGKKGINIQRYKGLGEMNAEQLWETTMNPKNRTLRKLIIKDNIEADNIFSILMGDNVLPRREFIEKNSIYAKIDI
ncbi:MAG: DNA topoisomerase (ATP-hydrolyzing) subunit B [Candidatus Bostrichicola ureolyticus]|nr:MAG: DNA topoisomerase (ATP-hydrolyzing) subunit B [Candidatus Bostrichicola ureolyticus]